MVSDRKIAIIVGVLFIIGFAGVLTVVLTGPILDSPDYLIKISANENKVLLGAFFQFIMGVACAGDWVGNVAVLLTWCISALMYYSIFYRKKLVPRWLSGWGLIGVTLTIVGSVLIMFRLISPMGTIQGVLNAPIALQEMVLAVWLIVKGFNPAAIASGSAKQMQL